MAELVYFGLIFGGMLMGIQGERWRAAWARAEWRARKRRQKGNPRFWLRPVRNSPQRAAPDLTCPAEQLRIVMDSDFDRRPLLNKGEYRVFACMEEAAKRHGRGHRVMAQVNLGEILSSTDGDAFRAINSKRVDLLLICPKGMPLAAFEYQGEGHYQGTAPARDAVKKEALRKAGVRYVEVTPEDGPDDVHREVSRILKVHDLAPAPEPILPE